MEKDAYMLLRKAVEYHQEVDKSKRERPWKGGRNGWRRREERLLNEGGRGGEEQEARKAE